MTFLDLDERRRMEFAMAEDRKLAFHIISRPDGLRAAMIDCYNEGADRLEDEAYEVTAHGGTIYGFWIQDLANALRMEATGL